MSDRKKEPSASVLVVDDESVIRESMGEFLQGVGFKVETADSEEGALESMKRDWPDAVVSDLVLERGSGLALMQKIRKSEKPKPCMVLMTGYGTLGAAIEALRLGACDFFMKPVKLVDLERALTGCLEQNGEHAHRQMEGTRKLLERTLKNTEEKGLSEGSRKDLQKALENLRKLG